LQCAVYVWRAHLLSRQRLDRQLAIAGGGYRQRHPVFRSHGTVGRWSKKYSTASNPLKTSVSLVAGKHRFAVLAIYGDGTQPDSAVYATVK
jgi:hypothetical protein